MSKRLTKEDLHEDEVLTSFYRVIGYVEANYPKILAAVGALAVAVLIAVFIKNNADKKEQAAIDALGRIQIAMMQGQMDASLVDADRLARDNAGTKIAAQALLMLGNAYYGTGRYEEGRLIFQKYLDEYGSDGPDGYGAWVSVGACMEQQGNQIGAADHYANFADAHAGSPFSSLALLEAARSYEDLGNRERAVKALTRIKSDYPDATVKREAEAQLREMGAS
jgi:outer membrane protein assembly factor BamD (BamD/ComL family)